MFIQINKQILKFEKWSFQVIPIIKIIITLSITNLFSKKKSTIDPSLN